MFCPAGGRVANRRRSLPASSSSSVPGKASFRRLLCHAHAIPTEGQLGGLPGPGLWARQHRAHRNPEAADRAAELPGLLASVVGEVPLGAGVGEVGPGSSWVAAVAAWRMKMTCPPSRRRVTRSRPPGCSASVAGTPDPVDPDGPGRFPPHPATAASRRHATSATGGRRRVPAVPGVSCRFAPGGLDDDRHAVSLRRPRDARSPSALAVARGRGKPSRGEPGSGGMDSGVGRRRHPERVPTARSRSSCPPAEPPSLSSPHDGWCGATGKVACLAWGAGGHGDRVRAVRRARR